MKKISVALITMIVSGLVLVGCQMAPIVHLINMSGRDVRVIVLNDELPLVPLQEVEFAYPYSELEAEGMSVRYEQCIMTYLLPPPPKIEYTRYRGIRVHFNVRLDSDWSIRMLPPTKGELTGPQLEEQPEGFPLIPTRSGKCEE